MSVSPCWQPASCCAVWRPRGAVGQHVRVHQPDVLLRSGRRRGGAAPAAVPRAVGVRAAAGAGAADGLGQMALHPRRAGDARAAVLLAADPRLGGQPRLGSLPGRWCGQRAVPAEDVPACPAGRHGFGRMLQRLPDAQLLDRIAYRTTIFAFPVFGFGVIFGAIWAEEAWGRYWGWDPKETVSFIAWVVLRRVPARPVDRGLARQEGRLDQRRRFRRDGLQPVLHQSGHGGSALLRGV